MYIHIPSSVICVSPYGQAGDFENPTCHENNYYLTVTNDNTLVSQYNHDKSDKSPSIVTDTSIQEYNAFLSDH